MEYSEKEKEIQRVLCSPGVILVYGPAGAGKTLLCLEAAAMQEKGKIIYIDCQNSSFPIERLLQLNRKIGKDALDERIFFINPKDFFEQVRIIKSMTDLRQDISLLVVDNITYLYRLKKGKYGESLVTIRALISQARTLNKVAKRLNIPVIITSHVYARPGQKYKAYGIIGGDILKKSAQRIVALTEAHGMRKMKINEKGKSSEYFFSITENGIKFI